MTPIESAFRSVRIVHSLFLLTPAVFIFLLLQVHPAEREVNPLVVAVFAMACFSNIGVAIFFRTSKVKKAEDTLLRNPTDTAALAQWRLGLLLSWVLAQVVADFGIVLKFLGSPWKIVSVFFAVAFLLMLAWRPKLELPGAPG